MPLAIGKGSGLKSVPVQKSFPHSAHAEALRRPDGTYSAQRARVEFMKRWQRFICLNFVDIAEICDAFDCTDKAARKWLAGEGGVNGVYTQRALELYPVQALQILYPEALSCFR